MTEKEKDTFKLEMLYCIISEALSVSQECPNNSLINQRQSLIRNLYELHSCCNLLCWASSVKKTKKQKAKPNEQTRQLKGPFRNKEILKPYSKLILLGFEEHNLC